MFVCGVLLLHSLLVSSPHDVENDDGEGEWNTIYIWRLVAMDVLRYAKEVKHSRYT